MSETNKLNKFLFEQDFETGSKVKVITERDLENARKQGYQEGLIAGSNQAEELFAQHLNPIINSLSELRSTNIKLIKNCEVKSLQLLQHILHKLIKKAANNFGDEILQSTINDALALVLTDAPLTLKLSPEGKQFFESKPDAAAIIAKYKITVVEDSSLSIQDCVLEWNNGGLDARLSKAMQDIDEKFNSSINSQQEASEETEGKTLDNLKNIEIAEPTDNSAQNVQEDNATEETTELSVDENDESIIPKEAMSMVEIVEENNSETAATTTEDDAIAEMTEEEMAAAMMNE